MLFPKHYNTLKRRNLEDYEYALEKAALKNDLMEIRKIELAIRYYNLTKISFIGLIVQAIISGFFACFFA